MTLKGTGTIAVAGLLVLAAFTGCIGMDPLGGNESNETGENLSTSNVSLSNQSTTNATEDTFAPGNATLAPNTTTGQAPLPINFTLNATTHANGTWTLLFGDGNQTEGNTTTFPANVTYTYQATGNYTANFTVSYPENVTRSATTNLTVSAPETNATENETSAAPCEDPIGTGTILIGHPGTFDAGVSASQESGQEGLDGFSVEIPESCWGTSILVAGSSPGPYDLDLFFYNADGEEISGGCATADVDETCEIPEGTATGWVAAYYGANVEATISHA